MSDTRRRFLGAQILAGTAALGVQSPAAVVVPVLATTPPVDGLEISLDGEWEFRKQGDTTWRTVTVPHTWQVMDGLENYYGVAHYRRSLHAPAECANAEVYVEFESVFHTAEVKLNGSAVGEHRGKGYTAFRTNELSSALKPGADNVLEVRVDNSFADEMLPRSHSSDWAHDGGIYRPVHLLVLPKAHFERVHIDAWPDNGGVAQFSVHASFVSHAQDAVVELGIVEQETGLNVHVIIDVRADETIGSLRGASFRGFWENARYWHFDHPHLYSLEATLVSANGTALHRVSQTFGVRKFEVNNGGFHLNGERVRLMGVERMAGSNPEYGMAEPSEWIEHDHADMKNLNCVFTRVHWQQDRRVLDWCDRHGILVQLEVPTWGGGTFQDLTPDLEKTLQQNGIDQLRELIAQNRNHPSVVAWGLCNEINGQNPPAAQFARNMLAEAKKLDPTRPCTYASNSLEKTPARDVSAFMDYVSWNQYYGSWSKGTSADMENNLAQILMAFPGKPVVISEYGYCACTADRPEGDEPRIRVLREQDAVLRRHDRVAGLIFFCYNDYRTHIGDRGKGALKQRVHGVVDVYGRRKPSYEVLRKEASPVETLSATLSGNELRVGGRTRASVPGYTLRGYTLEAVVCGQGDIPVERQRVALPDLAPGAAFAHAFTLTAHDTAKVRVEIRRPTGFSARSVNVHK